MKIMNFVVSVILAVALLVGVLTFWDAYNVTKDMLASNAISRTIRLEYARVKLDYTNIIDNPFVYLENWWIVNIFAPTFGL